MKAHELHNLKGTIIIYALLVIFLSILISVVFSRFLNIPVLPAGLGLICLIGVMIIFAKHQVDLEIKLALAINAASGFTANFILAILNRPGCLNKTVNYWLTHTSLYLGIASIVLLIIITAKVKERRQIFKFSLLIYLSLTLAECLVNIFC